MKCQHSVSLVTLNIVTKIEIGIQRINFEYLFIFKRRISLRIKVVKEYHIAIVGRFCLVLNFQNDINNYFGSAS